MKCMLFTVIATVAYLDAALELKQVHVFLGKKKKKSSVVIRMWPGKNIILLLQAQTYFRPTFCTEPAVCRLLRSSSTRSLMWSPQPGQLRTALFSRGRNE